MQASAQVDLFFKQTEEKFVKEVFEKRKDRLSGKIHRGALQAAMIDLGMILPSQNVEDFFKEMDFNNDGMLEWVEFQQLVTKPTEIEQWASQLRIARLLASCFPPNVNNLREVCQLGCDELEEVLGAFAEGMGRLLRGALDQLRQGYQALDQRTKEGASGIGKKFVTFKLACGSVEDFHKGMSERIGMETVNLESEVPLYWFDH